MGRAGNGEARQFDGRGFAGIEVKGIPSDRGIEWRATLSPVRNQFFQRSGFQHGPRQHVSAYFGTLFYNAYRGLTALSFGQLHDLNRGTEPSRTRSHDYNVELHGFSFHIYLCCLTAALGLCSISPKFIVNSGRKVISNSTA